MLQEISTVVFLSILLYYFMNDTSYEILASFRHAEARQVLKSVNVRMPSKLSFYKLPILKIDKQFVNRLGRFNKRYSCLWHVNTSNLLKHKP